MFEMKKGVKRKWRACREICFNKFNKIKRGNTLQGFGTAFGWASKNGRVEMNLKLALIVDYESRIRTKCVLWFSCVSQACQISSIPLSRPPEWRMATKWTPYVAGNNAIVHVLDKENGLRNDFPKNVPHYQLNSICNPQFSMTFFSAKCCVAPRTCNSCSLQLAEQNRFTV